MPPIWRNYYYSVDLCFININKYHQCDCGKSKLMHKLFFYVISWELPNYFDMMFYWRTNKECTFKCSTFNKLCTKRFVWKIHVCSQTSIEKILFLMFKLVPLNRLVHVLFMYLCYIDGTVWNKLSICLTFVHNTPEWPH